MDNNVDEQFSHNHTVEENRKYPGPLAAGVFFTITTLLLTYGGILLPFRNNFLNSGFGEILFILLPVIIFLFIGKYDIKGTLKLRKIKPINYLVIPALMIFSLPIVAIVNAITLGLIRLIFGKNLPVDQIAVSDVPTLLIAILVIGVSAAVCEETLFRGLISKSYERYGVIASLAITSILFGILHRDIQKCIGVTLLGVLIGFIVYRTQSIYAGMIAHFTNNTIIVFFLYSTSSTLEQMREDGSLQFNNFDFSSISIISWIFVIIFYMMVLLVSVAVFVALLYAFCKINKVNSQATEFNKVLELNDIDLGQEEMNLVQDSSLMNQKNSLENQTDDVLISKSSKSRKLSVAGFLAVLPGLILIILTFIGEILELMNINSGTLYNVLKALWLISPK